jgi:hypothetical protein
MLWFLGSAAISYLLFQFAALAIPTKFAEGWSIIWRNGVSLRLSDSIVLRIRILISVLIVIAVLIIGLLMHNFLDGQKLEVFRQHEENILVGFIFGVVFAIWINLTFASDPAIKDVRQTILMFLLALLFVFGAVGHEASRLVQKWLDNASSLSAAGVTITLNAPSGQNARSFIGSSTMSSSFNGQGATLSSGTRFLVELAGIMKVDCKIIHASTRYTKYITSQWKSYIFDSSPDCDETSQLTTYIEDTVSSPARCLGEIYSKTQDTAFLRSSLGRIAQILQGPASSRFGSDAQAVRYNLAFALYDFGQNILYYLVNNFGFDEELRPDADDASVILACVSVIAEVCGAPGPPDSSAPLNTQQRPFPQCVRDAIRFRTGRMTPAETDAGIAEYERLNISAGVANTYLQLQHSRDTPYLSMAYSALSAAMGDYERGLEALDHWIDQHEAVGGDQSERARQQWLLQRARLTEAFFFGEWLSQGVGNDQKRDVHLKNLQAIVEAYDKMNFTAGLISAAQKQGRLDSVSNAIESGSLGPEVRGECLFHDKDFSNLVYNYALTKLAFANHALSDSKFKSMRNQSLDYVEDIFNIDPACLIPTENRDDNTARVSTEHRDSLFADAMNFYARVEAYGVHATEAEQTESEKHAMHLVRNAIKLGVDKAGCDSQPDGYPPQDFAEKINVGDRQDSCQQLTQTTSYLQEFLNSDSP